MSKTGKKRIAALLLTLGMVLSLACGCGPNKHQEPEVTMAVLKIEGDGANEAREFTAQQLQDTAPGGLFQGDFVKVDASLQRGKVNIEGVNLWYLLHDVVGIKQDAKTISIVAYDGFQATYSIDQVQRQEYIDEQEPDQQYPMTISWNYGVQSGVAFAFLVGQDKPGEANKDNWIMNIEKIVVK